MIFATLLAQAHRRGRIPPKLGRQPVLLVNSSVDWHDQIAQQASGSRCVEVPSRIKSARPLKARRPYPDQIAVRQLNGGEAMNDMKAGDDRPVRIAVPDRSRALFIIQVRSRRASRRRRIGSPGRSQGPQAGIFGHARRGWRRRSVG